MAGAWRGTLALALIPAVAGAQSESSMNTACRDHAARAFKVPAGAVQVEYTGQRTDKSHAVNGSARVGSRTETFQCSFDSLGSRITRWVISTPKGGVQAGAPEEDREAAASRRAGAGNFDARGQVPCAQYKGQPVGQCMFGVARAGGGTATVVITRSDGRTRAIFFRKGVATNADTGQADGYPAFSARKEADLYLIRIGDERYEIPEAVVYGG
jgi:hypothetical protein